MVYRIMRTTRRNEDQKWTKPVTRPNKCKSPDHPKKNYHWLKIPTNNTRFHVQKNMLSRQAMDSKTMFSFIFNFPNIWADCCKMLNINKLQIAPRWQVGAAENFCNYHDERFG